ATPGTHQPSFNGVGWAGFVAKFNSAGTRQWGSYYIGPTGMGSVAHDASGNIFIGGYTQAPGLATPGAWQFLFGGQEDLLVARFNGTGSLLWSSYYGGPGHEEIAKY